VVVRVEQIHCFVRVKIFFRILLSVIVSLSTTYCFFLLLNVVTAHGPRGTQANLPIYVYQFNPNDGSMILLNISGKAGTDEDTFENKQPLVNPAFTRFHPRINVVYTCTEDVMNNGIIVAYEISPNGSLKKIGQVDAGGTSTCYITIDRKQEHLIVTNYWDSTLCVIPIDSKTGAFTGPIMNTYDPKQGFKMQAAAKLNGGCNHSNNDESTIRERQKDPHSHALVLDTSQGCIAYVPDLGKDLVREMLYNPVKGEIVGQLNVLPSGMSTGNPDGPRYIEFHPTFDIAYVVNELSSTIAVFSVDRSKVNAIARASRENLSLSQITELSNGPTLQLIQSVRTVPEAFPTEMNTCGRVTVHPSGNFVIVSNRGHESIAIFRVMKKGSYTGQLRQIGFYHTYGETPRHFQFDASGQYLIVANQDSDSLNVFSFNLSSGEIKFTGNKYGIPSPNFVCNCVLGDTRQPESMINLSEDSHVLSAYKNLSSFLPTNAESVSSSDDGTLNFEIVNENEEASKEDILLKLKKATEEIYLLKKQLARV